MTPWQGIISAARPASVALLRALDHPKVAQARLLAEIVAENAETEFGRRHGFDRIHDADEFRRRVPIESHTSREADIQRIAEGCQNVRTREAVIAFEETGGSTRGGKLVPYTSASLAAFRDAALPWLADLALARPGITRGSAYFSISPATRRPRTTAGGVLIGLASDAAYLGEDVAPFLAALSITGPDVGAIADVDQWRRMTLTALLGAEDLTLISVWSPTFLSGLLDHAAAAWPAIAGAVREHHGRRRESEIERALASSPIGWAEIWPMLDTVSAWAHAASAGPAASLAAALPHVWLQPKGLLATEGVMTVPLLRAAFPLPALTSGFFEFIEDEAGDAGSLLAGELSEGRSYRMVMTTPGGFYRYDIGDRVRCRGFCGEVPMLEFVGRVGLVSDLAGEKLTEDFVAARLPPMARFACLLAQDAPRPGYVLMLDGADAGEAPAWAAAVDRALSDNPQYAYARRMGQLGPVSAAPVSQPEGRFIAAGLASGRRLGDIKLVRLLGDTGLAKSILADTTGDI